MCGEHCGEHSASFGVLGSSPHVRGAHGIHPQNLPTLGIIPACAGSTIAFTVVITAARDHPRMCGEHIIRATKGHKREGSSPHVRGARHAMTSWFRLQGIIPACAGSTRVMVIPSEPTRDHPRMCGEHALWADTAANCAGSSPHVRGALLHQLIAGHRAGIIPACAGSTVRRCAQRSQRRDHPRMCGEHELPKI